MLRKIAAPTAPCAGCEHKAGKIRCELRVSGKCLEPVLVNGKYDYTNAWKQYVKRTTY